ncbi:MAG: chitobiase/beta-hexosaminidase C-terminal domain-containing protein, partial [Candidatus Binatia bacterium]
MTAARRDLSRCSSAGGLRAKRIRGVLCTLALILGLTPGGRADALVISEFLAINDTTLTDDDGDYSDWLEIHNDEGAAVNLDGWYLTDDAGLLTRWRMPAVTIEPDGYLLIWASGKNRNDPAFPLHTDFKISGGGEYLALVQSDGTTVEHDYFPAFPIQAADTSYGLASDLLTERCFFDPTPQAMNDESRPCGFVDEPGFSVGRGFYDQPFSVALTSPTPGATIHYTVDGSDPDPDNGAVYVSPLSVTGTTVLRAMAFKTGLAPSASVTHTYIFLDDVIQQSASTIPPRFPANWSGGSNADYDMDPAVVNDPLYAPTIKDDLQSIPTMSIVTDVDNLFGSENGIYVHLKGRGVKWERPVSAELIFADGRKGFQINCGIRIQGSTSRTRHQKKYSLRLLFKSAYGPSKLVFPVFPDSPVDSFDAITLTAGHGNSWPGQTGSRRAQYLRDTWAKDTQIDMGRPASHSTYVHLYLNGL